jgi:hypothetical protein
LYIADGAEVRLNKGKEKQWVTIFDLWKSKCESKEKIKERPRQLMYQPVRMA